MIAVPFATTRGIIDLAHLKPGDIVVEDIASSLSRLVRFTGRTTSPWSVAAHSLFVAELCQADARPWALLHDAHEMFLGDITTPAVHLICHSAGQTAGNIISSAIGLARNHLDRAVLNAFGMETPSAKVRNEVERADELALWAELVVLMGVPEAHAPRPMSRLEEAVALLHRIIPQVSDPEEARTQMLRGLEVLTTFGARIVPRLSHPADASPDGQPQKEPTP